MAVALSCCCDPVAQPAHPGAVLGWVPPNKRHGDLIATLVLKKGEKSQNDNIGVEVSSIFPPERPCAKDSVASLPSAIIRFYRPKDNQTLCEQKVYSPSSMPTDCPSEVGVYSTFVHAINYADNWVFFELR
jgi:hypothetical protein